MKATGGIVKLTDPHIIGEDHCSHCIPFPDPDYSKDFEMMTGKPDFVIPPIIYEMSAEELEKEIMKSVKYSMMIIKSGY